jgi:hypothetical protein
MRIKSRRSRFAFIDDAWVEVRVYSDLHADPDVYDFPTKVSAIDFCRDVLRLRDGTD